jgi:hypothetical protein
MKKNRPLAGKQFETTPVSSEALDSEKTKPVPNSNRTCKWSPNLYRTIVSNSDIFFQQEINKAMRRCVNLTVCVSISF